MSKKELDDDFENFRKDIDRVVNEKLFNGRTYIDGVSMFNVNLPVKMYHEIKKRTLFFYFPLTIANYFADVSPDKKLRVNIFVKENIQKNLEIDISHDRLDFYLSPNFSKGFDKMEIIYIDE